MAAGKPRERELTRFLESRGYEILSLTHHRNNHFRAVLKRDGEIFSGVFANSPSDYRGDLNAISAKQLRRIPA